MRTWDDYKKHVKTADPESGKDIEEAENISAIVSEVIKKRQELGISQRELAMLCGIPQSSVARIESFRITPRLDTLLKLMKPLGLGLRVALVK